MVPGSVWVEGTELHWVDENGTERSQEGSSIGSPTATNGSIWIEGTDLHYIDASGSERSFTGTNVGSPTAQNGSAWIEDENLHYIDASGDERIVAVVSIVSNLTATDASTNCGTQFPSNSIDLAWDEDGDGSDVTHVEIWRRQDNCPDPSNAVGTEIATVAFGTGSYNDDTMGSGIQMCYEIRIQYTDGSHSGASNCDCATTC